MRVTLTGVHGTGKTFIVNKVAEELESRGHTVEKMPSVTRLLVEAGYQINDVKTSEVVRTQLVCSALRDYQQKLLDKKKPDFLLSDRFIFDELVYTRYFLRQASFWGDGHLEEALYTVERSILSLLELEIESSYWDLILKKEPHPDYLPEDDGHRSTELEFFRGVKGLFDDSFPRLKRRYPDVSRVSELKSLDRVEAVTEVLDLIDSLSE